MEIYEEQRGRVKRLTWGQVAGHPQYHVEDPSNRRSSKRHEAAKMGMDCNVRRRQGRTRIRKSREEKLRQGNLETCSEEYNLPGLQRSA